MPSGSVRSVHDGPKEYRHEVTVTSYYNAVELINSPLIFTATTGPTDPDTMVYVSGNHQVGGINNITGTPQSRS